MESHTPLTECPRCGSRLTEDASNAPICPNCALRAARPSSFWESQSALSLPQKYVRTVRRVLTEPSAFFREMPTTGGLGGPLAFALITHWLGKFASWLWGLAFGHALYPMILSYLDRLEELARNTDEGDRFSMLPMLQNQLAQMRAPGHWVHSLFGAASLALDPFLTLMSLFFTGLFIFVGARLFVRTGRDGAPTEVTFESVMRILCYASTPVILSFIPVVGGLAASIGSFVILVIGIREVYHSTTGRGVLVAVFPQLLLLALVLLAIFAFLTFFVSMFAGLMR